jgi:protein TonB
MKSLSLSSFTLVDPSPLSRSMLLPLTYSLLGHVIVLALCFYNWNSIPSEQDEPILQVELIDAPSPAEEEQTLKAEGEKVAKKYGPDAPEKGQHHSITTHYPTVLVAQGDDTQVRSSGTADVTPSLESEATVPLDSTNLKYVSYLTTIKKKISPEWHYPESAQQIGLQGRLALYFSIERDGHLDRLELLNSSGHSLLDEEALNAVRGAAPYYPLPAAMNLSRLNILATFEYKLSPYRLSSFSQGVHEESL